MSETSLRRHRVTRLLDARLYLCTDARERTGDLAEFADAALRGGVDVIQLRQKGMEARAEIAALEVLAEAAQRHGALLAVNDRADVAAAVRPDVLHLGQDDLPVPVARDLLGPDVLLGRSCHDEVQAADGATEDGIDYFCTGPCWPTPTKPGRSAPGLGLVRSAALTAVRPWFAIGGIDLARLPDVLAAGATRVVVVRAITEAEDPEAAARTLSAMLRGTP